MKFLTLKIELFLPFIILFSPLTASDATWTGATNADLNIPGNWFEDVVPNGIATFDSAYPFVQLSPIANSAFNVGSFNFLNNASNFHFTFIGPGYLNLGAAGITGANSNPQITAANSGMMDTSQIIFKGSSFIAGEVFVLNAINTGGAAIISGSGGVNGSNGGTGSTGTNGTNGTDVNGTDGIGDGGMGAFGGTAGNGTDGGNGSVGSVGGDGYYDIEGQIVVDGSYSGTASIQVGANFTLTAINNSSIIGGIGGTGGLGGQGGAGGSGGNGGTANGGDGALGTTVGGIGGDGGTGGNSGNDGNSGAGGAGGNGGSGDTAGQFVIDGNYDGNALFETGDGANVVITNSSTITGGSGGIGGQGGNGNSGVGNDGGNTNGGNGGSSTSAGGLGGAGGNGGTGGNGGQGTNGGAGGQGGNGGIGGTAGQIIVDGVKGDSALVIGNSANVNISNSGTITGGLGGIGGSGGSGGDGGTGGVGGDANGGSGGNGDFMTGIGGTGGNGGSAGNGGAGGNGGSGGVGGNGSTGGTAGQVVVDGSNNGLASFAIGNFTRMAVTNNGMIIAGGGGSVGGAGLGGSGGLGGVGGNANGGSAGAGFNPGAPGLAGSAGSVGDNGTDGTIGSPGFSGIAGTAAQFVFDGSDGGSAAFTMGNNSILTVTNNETISTSSATGFAAQILFDGDSGTAVFNGGTNATIIAVNAEGSQIITPNGGNTPAQIYFHNTTINGSPTIMAINQHTIADGIAGIIFDQNSAANQANIVLQNSSLVVNTTNSVFSIGSLTGDSTSVVDLSNDLGFNLAAGAYTNFAGVINGVGKNLIVGGLGTQELSGVNTFTGLTTVNTGNLVLNGSVVNDVVVNNGGILSGVGIVGGDLTINSGGIVYPGNSIGTLHINQDYTQETGGMYTVQISGSTFFNGTPQSSELDIGGLATLSGTLEVVSMDGTYSIGRPYTVLVANTLTGTFENTALTIPFLNIQTIYTQDPSVQILLSTNFQTVPTTPNGTQVATQIDGNPVPTDDEEVVINNLLSLSESQLSQALEEMTGEQYTSLIFVNQFSDSRFQKRIFDSVRDELDPYTFKSECGETHTWSSFDAAYGKLRNGNQVPGFQEHAWELSCGIDKRNNNLLLGAAANFESSRLSFNFGGSNTFYNVQGSIYGTYTTPNFYLFSDLIVGQGFSHFRRQIQFADINRVAQSKPRFTHGQLYAEFGKDFALCNALLQPFFGLECGYIYAQRITESSAESLDLHVDSHSVWIPNFIVGAHSSLKAGHVDFNADLAYKHRCGTFGTTLQTNFIEFGDVFTIEGGKYSRDGLLGAVNAVFNVGERVDLYVELSGELWKYWITGAASCGLSCTW